MDEEKLDKIYPHRTPEPIIKRLFAMTLRYRLELSGLSATEFSKRLGISRQSVMLYLSGNMTPRMDVVFNMSQVLNINVELLFSHKKTLDFLIENEKVYKNIELQEIEKLKAQIWAAENKIKSIDNLINEYEDLKKYKTYEKS